MFGMCENRTTQLKMWEIPVELIPGFDSTLTIDPVVNRNIACCAESAEISACQVTKTLLLQAIYANKEPYLQLYDPVEGRCLAHLSPSDLPFSKGEECISNWVLKRSRAYTFDFYVGKSICIVFSRSKCLCMGFA